MQEHIVIKGAREHNLKNIDLVLPRNKMIVLTGVSGSGKSSLAFDTVFAEGQRRYVESLSAYARQFLGQMQKPDVDEIEGLSPAIAIDQKAHSSNPRSTVATITEIYDYLRVLYARVGRPHCVTCKKEIRKLTQEEIVDAAIERTKQIHSEQVAENKAISGKESLLKKKKVHYDHIKVLAPIVRGRKGEYLQMLNDLYTAGFAEVRIDGKWKNLRERIAMNRYGTHTIELLVDRVPLGWPLENNKGFRSQLAEAVEMALDRANGVVTFVYSDGTEHVMSSEYACPDDGFSFPEVEPRLFSFNSPYGACPECHGLGTESVWSEKICPECNGARLRKEALHVWLGGKKSILDITTFSIDEAAAFFNGLKLNDTEKEISLSVLKEITSRLQFMLDVGLNYLTLSRKAGTLSGGEAQRIRLASQIGSKLVGALYVLDEPTIGLHQRDNAKLLETLTHLRDLGNTILVVEHDEDTIFTADHLVDFGPAAGKHGGRVVAQGSMPDVLVKSNANKDSLTVKYLNGDLKIAVPRNRRTKNKGAIRIKGASENNLKKVDVEIPLGKFVCLTGVSGSGKSTLMEDVLWKTLSNKLYGTSYTPGKHKQILGLEHLDKVIVIDQSPIGRTPRSNPATYTGSWTHIRELFASTAEARMRGYQIGRFSFNRPGGRCENCEGNGQIAIEMHFLPTVYVQCDVCKGRRFDRETLEVKYKDKSIHDILKMTVEEACEFFRDIPWVYDKLKLLKEVGLTYLELGQSATSLSGGEAQRVKLASELSKRQTGRTIYLLDEPTTGLHFADIDKLLEVLHRLVNYGNTVLVIEHNLDVIKTADHLIDLGPEGGDRGGEIVATGTPEEVARNAKSLTGKYLRKYLK
ncbi:MAG: excinuclease ABC subunit UvrA [Patescibacteria group bacterium]|nr:MAG: excinuclease ABC subunit UvrA [Patescibacteria group bacterium]